MSNTSLGNSQFEKALRPSRSFMKVYANRLMFWDFVVSAFSVGVSYFLNYRDLFSRDQTFYLGEQLKLEVNPMGRALILVGLWWAALLIVHSNNPLIAGTGIDEYVLLVRASVVALLSYTLILVVFKVDTSRLFFFEAFLIGIPLLVAHRRTGRTWLISRRKRGRFLYRTAITGTAHQVQELVDSIETDIYSGYKPVLVAVFADTITENFVEAMKSRGIEVRNLDESTFSWIEDFELQSLIVMSGDRFDINRVKQISWALEGTGLQLIIAPGLLDFAMPRLVTKPIGGVPLLFLKSASFKGPHFQMKSLFDLALAFIGVLVTSPIYLAVAIAIWIEDRGPVIFVQERVGKNKKKFKMLKFRSMYVGSEKLHENFLATNNKSPNPLMYKDPEDPRITKVGKFIRRWSLDELPQLLNVLMGQMSLVGPRPALPSEVDHYTNLEQRRLLVKPGLTGLWQTRGRATLNWEQTIRLDLDYVENWSLALDLVLLMRTFVVVFKRDGAG